MTDADVEFVRRTWEDSQDSKTLGPIFTRRLLALLVEAEARGDRARYELLLIDGRTNRPFLPDQRSQWTDANWQKAVRERWGI